MIEKILDIFLSLWKPLWLLKVINLKMSNGKISLPMLFSLGSVGSQRRCRCWRDTTGWNISMKYWQWKWDHALCHLLSTKTYHATLDFTSVLFSFERKVTENCLWSNWMNSNSKMQTKSQYISAEVIFLFCHYDGDKTKTIWNYFGWM